MHPELSSGRNKVELELPAGRKHQSVRLDPDDPLVEHLNGSTSGARV
jgi:hypothetical protein